MHSHNRRDAADVSQFAVMVDRAIKRKLLVISKAVVPDIALIDPATLTTMDAFLTACTGMDARYTRWKRTCRWGTHR